MALVALIPSGYWTRACIRGEQNLKNSDDDSQAALLLHPHFCKTSTLSVLDSFITTGGASQLSHERHEQTKWTST